MYSKAERQKAIDLYIKYGKRSATVVSKLGYPNRHTLRLWHKEFKEEGYLREGCKKRKGQGSDGCGTAGFYYPQCPALVRARSLNLSVRQEQNSRNLYNAIPMAKPCHQAQTNEHTRCQGGFALCLGMPYETASHDACGRFPESLPDSSSGFQS